ncbi:uncharacterized protein LOC128223425 [Mya arenaria]|uniref:uncharacterized protein LOC128223425 n=1 Tax=Mya arenaria TaxID=6604 RepID=UPI0022DF4CC9|nr:uncharacterized protein LOC128223425 [Mya arenaria]
MAKKQLVKLQGEINKINADIILDTSVRCTFLTDEHTEALIKSSDIVGRVDFSNEEKLEIQSGKLASALDDSETELVSAIIDEDCSLCDEAISALLDLKKYKAKLISKKEQDVDVKKEKDELSPLRNFLDNVERHLRSLEVLEQNINQDVFISMIRAKLPEDVLLQLEMLNGAERKWTIATLRNRLREYIAAREKSDKRQFDTKPKIPQNKSLYRGSESDRIPNKSNYGYKAISSAEALVANTKKLTPQQSKPSKDYSEMCRYCAKHHWSDECLQYRTLSARKQVLKESCFRCLKVGHKTAECKKNKVCVYCGERNSHHRSICPKRFKISESSVHLTEELPMTQKGDIPEENVLVSSGEMVLMQTAKTEVKGAKSDRHRVVRMLLDSGSQRSYVSEALARKLNLKQEGKEEINVMTFGSDKSKVVKTKISTMELKLKTGDYMTISVNIVPVISGNIQRQPMKGLSENANHLLKSVDLADDIAEDSELCQIDLLIGNDYYLDIVLSQKLEVQPGLYLLSSKFGWILTGRTQEGVHDRNDVNMLIMTYGTKFNEITAFVSTDDCLPKVPDLEDFWKIESIGINDCPTLSSDEKAMSAFKNTLQFSDGRYQVKWPWKDESQDIPVNRQLAMGRLRSTIARMKDKPELMIKYDSVIQDQLTKGIIEKVNARTGKMIHYLPHHAVITPLKTTTKLRVVYDASATSRSCDKSLNESLYRGPVLLHDLCGMLLRFRVHNIAVVADIEKAFLQIGLQPSDRDVTRFLWIKDCDKPVVNKDTIEEYRFCRVPFGIISSPFLVGATIESHLDSYECELSEKIKNDIYVDNLVTGARNITEAIELYSGTKQMFNEASMNIREWISNSVEVNTVIRKSDRATEGLMKVLGHIWDTSSDTFGLNSSTVLEKGVQTETKRTVLKSVASVFDPLGLYSPVVLQGKLLMQSLWKKQVKLDSELDDEDKCLWDDIKANLKKICEFQIPRCVTLIAKDSVIETSIVCFCDASVKAYSCVIYLQQETKGDSKVELVFAKTRLAPIKELTIPKLELMAVVVGVRCVQFVKEQLRMNIDNECLYTDSKCVLQWIKAKTEKSVFVRNRVAEIQHHQSKPS